MKSVAILFVFLIVSSPALADTIYVPDDYPKIQQAIDASNSGDEIIVRPGTYYENIDFAGRAVHVRSEQGAADTIIDGNQAGWVVSFGNGADVDSVLDGFTIANGYHHYAGGINVGGLPCGPTIINNIITGNSADDFGGGIYCYPDSVPVIAGNIITGNKSAYSGGGIHCVHSPATITGNTISENSASISGGGITCYGYAESVITNNIIENNTAAETGGGIFCHNAVPTVRANTITGNTATDGAGIHVDSNLYFPTITHNTISSNIASGKGGGIYCADSPLTLLNNLVTGNEAGSHGGGIHFNSGSDAVMTNNTVTMNNAAKGGGIACMYSNPIVTNTILWGNAATYHPEIWLDSTSQPVVTYCDVEGGWQGVGNIDADPLLFHGHLPLDSPCKDTGSNSALDLPAKDYEGDPRIVQGTVDMGADEFYYHLFHVGDVVPGSTMTIVAVGIPSQSVLLGQSPTCQDPPLHTSRGDLFLTLPLSNQWILPPIGANGVMELPVNVPAVWSPGEEYYFQALLGPWSGPGSTYSHLTNLMTLTAK